MAELKYGRYIVKMTLEQKLRLITSTEFYKSSPCGKLDFPVFSIVKQPYGEECKDVRVTQFPADAALANSWNSELIEDVYCAQGEEAHAMNSFAYYNCSNVLADAAITDNYFVLGKFNTAKINGLSRGNQFVNFENVPDADPAVSFGRNSVRDEVFANSAPSSAIFTDVNFAEDIKERYKYGNAVFGVVSTVREALEFLYAGGCMLFLAENIFDDLLNRLTSLTQAYKVFREKYHSDDVTESKFASLIRNFKVFDEGIIDKACNDVISILFSMKSAKEAPCPELKGLSEKNDAYFDELTHAKLAINAARQSTVLLKNEGCLPLNTEAKIAVIGECANDLKYRASDFNSTPTVAGLPFNVINDYGFKTTGFALGYAKGESGRSDLIDSALKLAAESDYTLLYLHAPEASTALPKEQAEVLEALSSAGAKVVAVVNAGTSLDFSFTGLCAAVLYVNAGGQGSAAAVFDIISGTVCPSGKLAKPLGTYAEESFQQLFPMGYGLSYTTFEYTNLKVNEEGVSFTVRNTGEYSAFAVPQMFIRKKDSAQFAERQLKGFTKVFVKAGDAVRVRITFDEQTFRSYNEEKGNHVEEGRYVISVIEAGTAVKITGKIVLNGTKEGGRTFKNDVSETSEGGKAITFDEGEFPPDVVNAKKKLPFGLRLFLLLLFGVYADGLLCLFAFGKFVQKSITFYVIEAVVAVIVNVFVIVYVVLICKQRKKQNLLHKNDVLTDMIENVEEFTEVAKVKYKVPIADEKEVDLEGGAENADEQEEEERAASYEANFDAVQEDVAYSERTSYEELCANLREFSASKGINVEINSARVLLAAILSCKLVFLTSKTPDLLPSFARILNGYYGNAEYTEANDEWQKPADLLWQGNQEKYVPSPFSNAVYGAYCTKEKQCAMVIGNVNINNLGSYFRNFLDYANHPTEEHVLKFNDDTSFKLSDNVTYVLVPQNGSIDQIPPEILNGAIVAEVVLSTVEASADSAVEPKVISMEDFRLLMEEAKEVAFVSEKIWKKVDALAENINSTERFSIGNKSILQMERFSSVLMDCGADEQTAVTAIFLAKLVYILKNTRMYKQDGGEKTLFALIEKLFADEELTKIQRALVKPVQE